MTDKTIVSDSTSLSDGQLLSEKDDKRVRSKIDAVVMPLVAIAMTLAFLDKNGLGYAAVWGLETDTHLQGQQYSWLGSIFYFGYLGMELPNLWLITKVPLGRYLGGCLTAWGGCLCLLAACNSFAGLATIRFLLGVFEAAMLPCLLLVNSRWYRREEQPLRTAIWYNTLAGVFGGILSYAIGHIHGALQTWRYIFLIYGSVTVAFGVLVILALPDRPATAWFLSPGEKKMAEARVAANKTGAAASLASAQRSRMLDADLAGVYLMGFYNVPWVLALSLQTSNTAGITKKSFVSVSIAVFYAVGNIVGPQFFRSSQAPHYSLGIGAMLCAFAVMAATGGFYFIACFQANRSRERSGSNEGDETDTEDLTDCENRSFRYVY
ncbi:hypothetical protein ASPZODRAFT_20202 [Penicilliopsis zonata CBS 506.65]|uniref:Major facilitator superfamily (MFS) profile domain-containing protein n=1 Tax=Penicilliopsis zonata CBS 506.65 TaxID=1073090 RepID=A0A1L9S6D0_9EURO|nr:hypothetical protein ASPZODRAFT_20202 [Penicilliopsis zonata CBS 506.65]OJJ42673.1 hypothetical protein ASPZODRAFT_20202 [Penicilliopsis zonata CBS 506.65]